MLYIVTDSSVIICQVSSPKYIESDGGERLIVVNSRDDSHWNMIPPIRCSGVTRNNLLSLIPSILAGGTSLGFIARAKRVKGPACRNH